MLWTRRGRPASADAHHRRARRCSTAGCTCRCPRSRKAPGAQSEVRMLHVPRRRRRATTPRPASRSGSAYTIADDAEAMKKNSAGTQFWGPAGAAVWSAPTIDTKRGLLYVATGNAYNDPAAETSDAVIAFDLKTGKLRWVATGDAERRLRHRLRRRTPRSRDNCPEDDRPGLRLRQLADPADAAERPKRSSTIGQKSGVAWGLDPDQRGRDRLAAQRRQGQRARRHGVGLGRRRPSRLLPDCRAELARRSRRALRAATARPASKCGSWPPTSECQPGAAELRRGAVGRHHRHPRRRCSPAPPTA